MRIYITGVSGLLGGNLAYLLKDRAEIYGCDRNRVMIPGLSLSVFDCMDGLTLRQDVKAAKPDVLIHCAGITNVDGCERDPETAFKANVRLTGELAEICREQGIKLVFLSSDAVYDGNMPGLHREEEEPVSCNTYGTSKILAERELTGKKMEKGALILRTNFLGYNIRNRKGFFEWLLENMRSGSPVTLFRDVYFSPLSITSLTEIIWESIQKDLKGVYNASSTGSMTKLEFGMCVKECFGLSDAVIFSGKVADAPLVARRSLNMGMDNTKTADALGTALDTPEDTVRILYNQYCSGYPQMLRMFRDNRNE